MPVRPFARIALRLFIAAVSLISIPAAASPAALIYGHDAVSTPDSVTLPTMTEGWFTQGNGTSIPGTQVPSYWVNKVGGELATAIEACSSPDMSVYNQLFTCMMQQGSALHGVAIWETAGTYSFTVPANVTFLHVRIWGCGGNGQSDTGAGYAPGGGGGGYSESFVSVTPGATYTATVAAAGSGGTSSFGGGTTANCGSNGSAGGAGGTPGTAINGLTFAGKSAGLGGAVGPSTWQSGGGGDSYEQPGGRPQFTETGSAVNGAAGAYPGAGASGGAQGGIGASGGPSLIIVNW